jgi:hypothetical protein
VFGPPHAPGGLFTPATTDGGFRDGGQSRLLLRWFQQAGALICVVFYFRGIISMRGIIETLGQPSPQ